MYLYTTTILTIQSINYFNNIVFQGVQDDKITITLSNAAGVACQLIFDTTKRTIAVKSATVEVTNSGPDCNTIVTP